MTECCDDGMNAGQADTASRPFAVSPIHCPVSLDNPHFLAIFLTLAQEGWLSG